MYRMAVLAMLSSDTKLDISKCVTMCLVHDLAEAHVGDITPSENIPKEEKARREAEQEAMHNFVHDMLHGTPAALRILSLYEEYEEGQTAEAKFVKDLDRFEMASQGEHPASAFKILHPTDSNHQTASEYEHRYGAQTLQSFFDSSLPNLRHPEVKSWGEDLAGQRQRSRSEASN
ncbi:hypothetical protein D9615_002190 [Tricholomella constricta]|uniref:HD domain-containing protein n=1 Tax=Tricholomella constricta TaxID=117010 RepID=A0A8H5HLR2_9AGAR|nr:hypothetical protein D9615_002190 [Tricholomella constricta]